MESFPVALSLDMIVAVMVAVEVVAYVAEGNGHLLEEQMRVAEEEEAAAVAREAQIGVVPNWTLP